MDAHGGWPGTCARFHACCRCCLLLVERAHQRMCASIQVEGMWTGLQLCGPAAFLVLCGATNNIVLALCVTQHAARCFVSPLTLHAALVQVRRALHRWNRVVGAGRRVLLLRVGAGSPGVHQCCHLHRVRSAMPCTHEGTNSPCGGRTASAWTTWCIWATCTRSASTLTETAASDTQQ